MIRRLRAASPQRLAVLGAVIVGVVVGAAGIAQAVGGAAAPPAKPLAQAIYSAVTAPSPQGITARIHFTNNLLPSGSLEGAASPIITGANGRLWLTGDGRLRLELQSDAGDAQIVIGDGRFSIYDAKSNTVYTGALAQDQQPTTEKPATLDGIRQSLAQLGQMWNLSGATPGTTAGQPSYTVRIAPKDDGGLLGAAEVAWDAARGVPLRAAVYAQGQKAPVLELKATDISYGKIAASDVTTHAPANAKTVELNPPASHDAQGNPVEATGLDAVQKQVGFTVAAPDSLAGLPRKAVRLVKVGEQSGALVTYGQGLGAIVVLQRASDPQDSKSAGGGLRLPQINIDGKTGSELATALGTVLTFDRGGVSYIVIGSVPPSVAENAARGLK